MKTNNILLIAALGLISCYRSQDNTSPQSITKPIENEVVQKIPVNQDLSDHMGFDSLVGYYGKEKMSISFKFNANTSKYFLHSISVYEGNNKIQTIRVNKEVFTSDFRLVDCNFDEYPDIFVCRENGSSGSRYLVWNYSVKEKRFIENKKLSNMIGLMVDPDSKSIIEHYREGYQQEYWDTLQYIDGKLIFVKGLYKERWNDSLGNFWLKHIRTRMIGNKPVTIIDSSIINK